MATERDLPDLDEVMDILRMGPSDVVDEEPPPHLWERIAADSATDRPGDDEGDTPSAPPDDVGPSVASLTAARVSRSRRVVWAVAAAAAVALVAVPLAVATRSGDPGPAEEVADLDRLGEFTGSGYVELRGRELTVEVEDLAPLDGAFYELWLLELDDDEVAALRSLGPIAGNGTFTVPDEVDLTAYDVVDISVEPADGDPTHSGDSVLRGQLSST